MHRVDGRSCCQHLPATYGSHRAISHHGWLSNYTQNTRFSIPSQHRKWDMLCYKERHPLLMKCFKTFFRCIEPMACASWCIFPPFWSLIQTFSTNVHSQNVHKMPHFMYPLSTQNGMLFYNERHPLLMKCSKSSLNARDRWEELLCVSLYRLWVSPGYVPRRLTLKSLTKFKVLGILSIWKYLVLNCEERHP